MMQDLPGRVEVLTSLRDGSEVAAGELYVNKTGLSFQYDASYIDRSDSYPLAPSVPLALGAYPLAGLGPFSDAAPDRWGRRLLERSMGRTRLREAEYLLGVNDLTRQGAYRFLAGGEPLAGADGVPVLTDLPGLLDTADAIQQGAEISETALRRLYRATGSLGGARPKATVRDRGSLWLAKFPKPQGDDWDVIGWEAVTLELAQMAGIVVPRHRTIGIADREGRRRTVLLTERFDRMRDPAGYGLRRIAYISAMTALEASDGQGGDWLDLVDFAAGEGGDTRQLWLRAMFGASIGNLDDHLRNHGFLQWGNGWIPAPAFDLNPEPYEDGGEDAHQLSLFGDAQVTPAALMRRDALDLFQISDGYARQSLSTIRSALAQAMPRAGLRHVDSVSKDRMAGRWTHALEELDALLG